MTIDEIRKEYLIKEMAKRGLKNKDLAAMIDRDESFVSMLVNGHRNIGKKTAKLLADAFGVKESALWNETQTPDTPPFQPLQPIFTVLGEKVQLADDVRTDDYYAVPMVEGRIAAGAGRIVSDVIQSFVWVYKLELGKRTNLIAVKLADDAVSMQPTLQPGYIVIIDRDDNKTIVNDKIYAVRLDHGACSIKRVQAVQDRVLVYADNTEAFKPKILKRSIPDIVIGRVVWFWGRLI